MIGVRRYVGRTGTWVMPRKDENVKGKGIRWFDYCCEVGSSLLGEVGTDGWRMEDGDDDDELRMVVRGSSIRIITWER